MEITKQDRVLSEIIRSITHDEKKAGDLLLAREYDLATKQMGILFRTLSDNDIVERTRNNSYILMEGCKEKAQKLYFAKVAENLELVKYLSEAANITPDILLEVFKEAINK